MRTYSVIFFVFLSCTAMGNVRAASLPHALPGAKARTTWTNEDLEQFKQIPGSLSVVGPSSTEDSEISEPRVPLPKRAGPAWYAAQAKWLNGRLEAEQAKLRDYTQALDDARGGAVTMPGISLDQPDIGLTPEATIEILKSRLRQTQSELDALEDLARRNDIVPGILRGQWQSAPAETAVNAKDDSSSDSSVAWR